MLHTNVKVLGLVVSREMLLTAVNGRRTTDDARRTLADRSSFLEPMAQMSLNKYGIINRFTYFDEQNNWFAK